MLIAGFLERGGWLSVGVFVLLDDVYFMAVSRSFRVSGGIGFAVLRHLPMLDPAIRGLVLGCSCFLKMHVSWRFGAHFIFFLYWTAVTFLGIYCSH